MLGSGYLPPDRWWINKFVAEGEALLRSPSYDELCDYLDRVTGFMRKEGFDNPRKGLRRYGTRMKVAKSLDGPLVEHGKATVEQLVEDVQVTIGMLMERKERQMDPTSSACVPRLEVNNSNTNNITVSSSAYSSSEATAIFKEARRNVDALGDDVLSREEKLLLKGMLSEIEEAEDESLGEKTMEAIKFISSKAFDVAKAVLPALAARLLGA